MIIILKAITLIMILITNILLIILMVIKMIIMIHYNDNDDKNIHNENNV